MKHLRYFGEFLGRDGTCWRAEIWQEADSAFGTVGELCFPAEEPLVIEWERRGKEEVVCGSVATLRIVSPGDRTYLDLYSIEACRVRLDVYRDGGLYWSGCLDTEFYEEPYERARGYEVSLAFSDFGVLDRLCYGLEGMRTVREVVEYCIEQCGMNTGGLDVSLVSTSLAGGTEGLTLRELKVRSDNFYDEDGDAMTLEEVLAGVLQPLALRVVQRAGKVWVYDLNGLYRNGERRSVAWDGDSQTLGADRVYNNAKVTWSTYAESGNLAPEECWVCTSTDAWLTALNMLGGQTKGEAVYYSYHYGTTLEEWADGTDCGFTLWTSRTGLHAELGGNVCFYKIVQQYDGEESEGVAIAWRAVRGYRESMPSGWMAKYTSRAYGRSDLKGTAGSVGGVLLKSDAVWLPRVASARDLVVRITVPLLLDPRSNPFEEASDLMKGVEQKTYYEQFGKYVHFVYVPVTVKFQPDDEETVYVWTNNWLVMTDVGTPLKGLQDTYGTWTTLRGSESDPNA